jgi:hypothetical protein
MGPFAFATIDCGCFRTSRPGSSDLRNEPGVDKFPAIKDCVTIRHHMEEGNVGPEKGDGTPTQAPTRRPVWVS